MGFCTSPWVGRLSPKGPRASSVMLSFAPRSGRPPACSRRPPRCTAMAADEVVGGAGPARGWARPGDQERDPCGRAALRGAGRARPPAAASRSSTPRPAARARRPAVDRDVRRGAWGRGAPIVGRGNAAGSPRPGPHLAPHGWPAPARIRKTNVQIVHEGAPSHAEVRAPAHARPRGRVAARPPVSTTRPVLEHVAAPRPGASGPGGCVLLDQQDRGAPRGLISPMIRKDLLHDLGRQPRARASSSISRRGAAPSARGRWPAFCCWPPRTWCRRLARRPLGPGWGKSPSTALRGSSRRCGRGRAGVGGPAPDFSSTVRLGKILRPSGTCTTARARPTACVGSRSSRTPSKQDLPPPGDAGDRRSPAAYVVLARAVGRPPTEEDSPLAR